MAKFAFSSRFYNTDMIIVDGYETVGTWNQPSYLVERPSEGLIAKFYVPNALEGRPDLIAQQIYGNPKLDWVLIAFNNPPELLNWPRAGDLIEIVDPAIVYSSS